MSQLSLKKSILNTSFKQVVIFVFFTVPHAFGASKVFKIPSNQFNQGMRLIGQDEVVMQVKNQTLDYKFKFTKNKLNSFLRPNIDSWTGRVFLGEQKICDSFLKGIQSF